MAGEVTLKDITIHTKEYYEGKEISIHLGEPIGEVRSDKREVLSKKGKTYPYDMLLVATGGSAFVPSKKKRS